MDKKDITNSMFFRFLHANSNYLYFQCLEKDGGGSFYVWTRWGRVGVVGQNKLEPFSNQASVYIILSLF